MPSVAPGVHELRIHTALQHRVLYVAKFAEGVYVLHAFRETNQGEVGLIINNEYFAYQVLKGGAPMTKPKLDFDKLARGLGAERRGQVKASPGYFGAAQLAAELATRLRVPANGGRPTDPT